MIKTLLIDDEPLTTQALRKVVEENFPAIEIISETTNGYKAWDLITSQVPDIIVSDICMPVLNGLELIEKIREAGLPIKVILVTAYSEFEYAKKAIQLGASGYLLKPFIQSELIHEIYKVIQEIDNEKMMQGYKDKVSKVIPIIEENALKKLLAGKIDPATYKEFLDFVGNKWDHCLVYVCQLGMENSNINDIEEIVKISIIEEINDYFLEYDFQGVSFFRKFNEIVLTFTEPQKELSMKEMESIIIQGCVQIIAKYFHGAISVGTSNCKYSLQQLPDAYENAINHISFTYENLVVPSDENMHTTFDYHDILMAKILDFCKQNYAKDISLQKAADHLNMNKFYFCTLFKEKVNVTFWDYITQLRIDQAKKLLTTTAENINKIALQIGYINSSHFGRIFKEIMGVTPAEYRRRNQ